MKKPYLLVAVLTFALCASVLVSVQGADVATVGGNSCDTAVGLPGSGDSFPPSSLPFQPFRLDDWGLMYLDYWRGEHFRSNAQVISLSLLGLFAAMAFVARPWSSAPPPSDAESPYSIFIRTVSSGTKCMDVVPSETLGSVKERLKVRLLFALCLVFFYVFDQYSLLFLFITTTDRS
jgi:hypothetical protein